MTIYYHKYLYMFQTSVCPSSGVQVVCCCIRCSALVVVAVVLRSRSVVHCVWVCIRLFHQVGTSCHFHIWCMVTHTSSVSCVCNWNILVQTVNWPFFLHFWSSIYNENANIITEHFLLLYSKKWEHFHNMLIISLPCNNFNNKGTAYKEVTLLFMPSMYWQLRF